MRKICLISLLAGSYFLTSCGGSSSSNDNPNVRQPTPPSQIPSNPPLTGPAVGPVQLNELETFVRADINCGSANAPSVLGPINFFKLGSFGSLAKVEDGVVRGLGNSSQGAKTEHIASVQFKVKLLQEGTVRLEPQGDDLRLTDFQYDDTLAIESEGEAFFICRTDYEQNTLEAQALSALYYLEKAATYFEETRGDFERLPDLDVWLFPEFKNVLEIANFSDIDGLRYDEVVFYDSDNAFHANFGEVFERRIIGFFARGFSPEAGIDRNLGTQLWLSPFVMGHEYGHHIFSEVFDKQVGSLHSHASINHVVQKILPKSPHSENLLVGTSPFARSVDVEADYQAIADVVRPLNTIQSRSIIELQGEVIGGFNEAFADVFGYLANDREPGQASVLGDGSDYRNVEISFLQQQRPKIIDDDIVRAVAFAEVLDENDFADIHVAGAVYGHIFANLLSKIATPESGEDLNSEENAGADRRGEILNKWLGNAATRYEAFDTDSISNIEVTRELISLMVSSFLDALSPNGLFGRDACDQILESMPAISERLNVLDDINSDRLVIDDRSYVCKDNNEPRSTEED